MAISRSDSAVDGRAAQREVDRGMAAQRDCSGLTGQAFGECFWLTADEAIIRWPRVLVPRCEAHRTLRRWLRAVHRRHSRRLHRRLRLRLRKLRRRRGQLLRGYAFQTNLSLLLDQSRQGNTWVQVGTGPVLDQVQDYISV